VSAVPTQLARLRERMGELADLRTIGYLLYWDQNTMMPPEGAGPRGHHSATLGTIAHERIADPELGGLLDALEPWAAGEDPDGHDARAIRWLRRDFEKAVRVPGELAAEMSREGALGQAAWREARAAGDFSLFRDSLARQIELRHRYAACFDAAGHPYDVLLDDYEPGLTTAELQPLLRELRDGLVPLIARAAGREQPHAVLDGPYEDADQQAAITKILEAIGFRAGAWRLDASPHPFAQPIGLTDMRITTRYDRHDLSAGLYLALHELGHGLYDAQIDPALARTVLGDGASFGMHESQSRLWENFVGRSRAFVTWLHGRLDALLPGGLAHVDPSALHRSVNAVRPSLVRIGSDETTYNLHIVLRFELELAMIEGRLAIDDVPAAWDDGMQRLLGVEVPGLAHGVLQDIHWASGLIGYFPTYTVGNAIAAQLWQRIAVALPDLDEQLERGDFAPLREWLREHVHRHGRTFEPRELLRRVTGQELQVAPLLDYLRAKQDAAAD
jgi:carboxypeptidase Taq